MRANRYKLKLNYAYTTIYACQFSREIGFGGYVNPKALNNLTRVGRITDLVNFYTSNHCVHRNTNRRKRLEVNN